MDSSQRARNKRRWRPAGNPVPFELGNLERQSAATQYHSGTVESGSGQTSKVRAPIFNRRGVLHKRLNPERQLTPNTQATMKRSTFAAAALLLTITIAQTGLAAPTQPILTPTERQEIPPSVIVAILRRHSTDEYHSTHGPCACPEDRTINGIRCGVRSAYSRRAGGAKPLCHLTDVTPGMIERWKQTPIHLAN